MYKYPALLMATFACICFSNCKKTTDSPGGGTGGGSNNNTPLFAASTGWQKVGTVKYTYKNMGFANQNSMQPEEIMKVGNQMEVLYSENYRLSGTVGRQFYKGIYTLGSSDTAAITKISLGSGTDERTGLFRQHFIPGTYEALALRYFVNGAPSTYLGIMNENGGEKTNHFIGHPGRNAKVYSNGDVLDGTIDYSNNAELDFYNKATDKWTYVKGSSHDTAELAAYTPFRLPGGELKAFNVMQKGAKIYLAIASPTPGASYPTPLYHSQFLEHVPSLDDDFTYTYTPAIICSIQDGDALTVVLGTFGYNSNVIKKLYAYKWVKGTNTFTSLYSLAIDDLVSTQLKQQSIQCLADGTIYFWLDDGGGASGALTIIDGSGVQAKGGITYNGSPVRLGAITNIDGAYYGVAYPVTDAQDIRHNLRMEIVKLK